MAELRIQPGLRTLMARVLACILLPLPCLRVSGAQEPLSSVKTTIRVNSDLVLVPVTVTDKSGRAVSGLEKEQFSLFEDNLQQEITHFAAEDAPVSMAIVFDASDSMAPKLPRAREAVNVLMNKINPESESSLVRVGTTAQIVVPLTTHFEAIQDAVGSMGKRGSTALLDGVHLAMSELTEARYSRKAIVIISDGEDNSSHWTVSELKAAVREQDILIYAIALADPIDAHAASPQPRGVALLREIASQTGGYTFLLTKLRQLPEVADKIGGWLRNQYILGYVPDHSAMDGTYHKIQLKLAKPSGYPRLQAVWRQGYFAPKE